jgi:hypothetical protein
MAGAIVICWIAAAGLGSWFRVDGMGTRAFLGLAALPIALFIMSDILGLGLRASAWVLMGVAAAGLAWRAREFSRTVQDRVPRMAEACLTPFVWLPVLVLAALAIRGGGASYVPLHWDEFSTWLLWPKLQFLTDRIWLDTMEIGARGYPPGWSLSLAFPQLFFGDFVEARSAAVPAVFTAALLGLLHDSVLGKAPSLGLRFLALGLLLWLPLVPVLEPLIPSEVLIEGVPTKLLVESPQILLNVALLALLFRMCGRDDGGSGRYWLAAGCGLVLAAGYFTKSAMVLFVPLVAVILAHHVAAHVTAGGVKRSRMGLSLAALMFGPFAALFVLWQSMAPETTSCTADPLAFMGSLLGADRQVISFGRFADESLTFFSSLSSPASGALLLLPVLALLSVRFRPLALTLIAWTFIYLGVLYWSYLGCFGGVEQAKLASLERYESVPFNTLVLAGALMGIAFLGERLSRFPWPAGWPRRVIGGALLATLVISAGAAEIADSVYRFTRMSDRFTERTQARYFGAAIQAGKKIRDIVRSRGLVGTRVLIIAQGSDGRERIALRYMRTPETRGGRLYLFDVADTYSWAPKPGNPYAKVATSRELLADILAADMVWPVRLDGWTGSAIVQVVKDPRCLANPRVFILVKRPRPKDDRDRFECILNDYVAKAG